MMLGGALSTLGLEVGMGIMLGMRWGGGMLGGAPGSRSSRGGGIPVTCMKSKAVMTRHTTSDDEAEMNPMPLKRSPQACSDNAFVYLQGPSGRPS